MRNAVRDGGRCPSSPHRGIPVSDRSDGKAKARSVDNVVVLGECLLRSQETAAWRFRPRVSILSHFHCSVTFVFPPPLRRVSHRFNAVISDVFFVPVYASFVHRIDACNVSGLLKRLNNKNINAIENGENASNAFNV